MVCTQWWGFRVYVLTQAALEDSMKKDNKKGEDVIICTSAVIPQTLCTATKKNISLVSGAGYSKALFL